MTRTDHRSDGELVADVAAVLTVPRVAPADSFVLHAPLELTARTALLSRVRPDARARARRRILEIASTFAETGAAVAAPPVSAIDDLDTAAVALVDAIDRGELDDVDRLAQGLGSAASPGELRRLLAPVVLDRLAAAAHAPIFLYHLPRVAPRGEITGELLRGLARELGRNPDWRVAWVDAIPERGDATPAQVFEALGTTAIAAEPEVTPFIYPTMHRVDAEGTAAGLLASVTGGANISERGRAVLRAAAWSMLLEPGEHAAYGWSHCLTLPQAVLGVADTLPTPSAALAIAATYVVGFRASLAREPLTPVFDATDPKLTLDAAIDAGPAPAAACAWYAPDDARLAVETELATRASTHPDAHLAKYTLACFDAAADDPAHRRLFLAAAASLSGWWAQNDS